MRAPPAATSFSRNRIRSTRNGSRNWCRVSQRTTASTARSSSASRTTRAPKRISSRESRCWSNSWLESRRAARRATTRRQLLNRAQKIAFAYFHAALAQQRVHHAFMEVEIRQHEIREVGNSRELPSTIGKLNFDGAALGAIDLIGAHGLEKIERLRNTLFELVQGRFRVFMLRDVDACEPCGCALGGIAGDLHLTNQRMHVRIQAQLRKYRGIVLLGGGMRGSLVQNRGQITQAAAQRGNGNIVQGNRHLKSPYVNQLRADTLAKAASNE